MNYPVNYKNISANIEFYLDVIKLHEEAEKYLSSFKWCEAIKDCSVYTNIGSIFCIFLFEIENTESIGDSFLWIVAGDFPPMYLNSYGPKTTIQVLEDYIESGSEWINNINDGKSIEDCYPFKAEPTKEMADFLKVRVDFMKELLLKNIDDVSLMV